MSGVISFGRELSAAAPFAVSPLCKELCRFGSRGCQCQLLIDRRKGFLHVRLVSCHLVPHLGSRLLNPPLIDPLICQWSITSVLSLL
jgi:hypothetical protein